MKKYFTILLSLASLITVAGCKNFLEQAPVLSETTEIALSDFDGLDKATLGAYNYLGTASWYGCDWIIESEMRSGNGMKDAVYDSGRCSSGLDWNYRPDATYSAIWAYCYYIAAAVNDVMDNLSGKTSQDVTQQDLNNLKAECLFLRALAHFDNVLLFGQPYTYDPNSLGVPYVEHTDPAGKPARETVAGVYNRVLRDLKEAEEIIDPSYVRSGVADPLATVNIYAIQALLCRVYLYMGDWDNTIAYADKVINSGMFKMWTEDELPEVWTKDCGSGEVIFEHYGKRTNSTYASWDDISYLTNPEGYADPVATPGLLALYDEGDVRLDLFRTDKDGKSGCMWTTKYSGKGDNAAPDCNNVIILRLSEMYLNRAEAYIRKDEAAKATSDLNVITSNRGAKEILLATLQNVKDERRKELAWEGHHFFDLARWNQSLVRPNEDFVRGTMNQNVEFPNYKWALPIPKREIELNENLVQNEGYGKTN